MAEKQESQPSLSCLPARCFMIKVMTPILGKKVTILETYVVKVTLMCSAKHAENELRRRCALSLAPAAPPCACVQERPGGPRAQAPGCAICLGKAFLGHILRLCCHWPGDWACLQESLAHHRAVAGMCARHPPTRSPSFLSLILQIYMHGHLRISAL